MNLPYDPQKIKPKAELPLPIFKKPDLVTKFSAFYPLGKIGVGSTTLQVVSGISIVPLELVFKIFPS